MVCKMASLGFVSAQALPNISLISNAKSVSRSRLLADSAPEKFIFWISVPISFCISTSLSNDALFSLILKNRNYLIQNRNLRRMLPFLRRIRTFAKNRLGKIGRLELRFLKLFLFSCGYLRLRHLFCPKALT